MNERPNIILQWKLDQRDLLVNITQIELAELINLTNNNTIRFDRSSIYLSGRLAGLIGSERARAIQQIAQTLNAAEAFNAGLVSEVVQQNDWEGVVAGQCDSAGVLSSQARQSLYRVLRDNTDDADMADLVRSVVMPGIKDRIAKYRAGE